MRTDRRHDAAYKARKQAGLQAVEQPWQWLTLADMKDIAQTAYKVASYRLNKDPMPTPEQSKSYFVDELHNQLCYYLAEAVVKNGQMPATVVPGMGANERAILQTVAKNRKLVEDWRPQYPAYQKVSPASAANAPGDVISADEGSANDHDSTH